jgi:hypothetical protein
LCERILRLRPRRFEIGLRRRGFRLRLNRAQIRFPARIHQRYGRAQVFLGRHDRIFEQYRARLSRFGSGVSHRKVIAEVDHDLPVARLSCADARLASRNSRAALSTELDRLIDRQRRLHVG